MLPPSWKREIEKAVEEKADASSERQKTEAAKNAAGVSEQIKAFVDAYNTQHNKPERKDKLKRFLEISTVVLLFGTAIFTGLGWLVFRGQLHEMQKVYGPIKDSADAARDAAAAANKSANVAERTLLSQRAVIAVERFDDFATTNSDNSNAVVSWTFRAYIKNTGGTEAINGHNHINLTLRKADLPDDFDYHDVKSSRADATSIIAAKEENQLMDFVVSIERALAIYRGEYKMFFYGWLEYDDVFEGTNRHRTEFSYKIGFPNDPTNLTFHKPMSFDPYGIRYNCIDKGCLYQPGHPPPEETEIPGSGITPQ